MSHQSTPFAPEEAIKIILPVLVALEFAHRYGVIHRELEMDETWFQSEALRQQVR
jgi:serine/threonine protein kinase